MLSFCYQGGEERMANILIRDIPHEVLDRLKIMAKNHNRSLQQELKLVLENTAAFSTSELLEKASQLRAKLRKKSMRFTDSADLLREDRTR
jgi:plasmid stability protein